MNEDSKTFYLYKLLTLPRYHVHAHLL